MFDAIGGQGNLGNIQPQLEFAWSELLTSENGVLKRLLSSNNVYDATKAFVGFGRPSGYSASNPQNSMHWDPRLASAEAAMSKFEGQVYATNQGVVTLGKGTAQVGQGMQGFGSSLQGLIAGIGAQRGSLGQFAGGLLSWAIGLIPGFSAGGWTGPVADHAVAGVVHGGEYVFDTPTTRKIGVANLEAIRGGAMPGYRNGGYVRDQRPWAGASPPGAVYRFAPNWKEEHVFSHLADARGIPQAEGYKGYAKLYLPDTGGVPRLREAACWAHLRRDFHDFWASTKSEIAREALDRIGKLYDIERDINGKAADARYAARQKLSQPKVTAFFVWSEQQLLGIPGKSDLAKACRVQSDSRIQTGHRGSFCECKCVRWPG